MSLPVPSFHFVDLSGRVALVTGANHGIGAATASRLARCGASVLLTYFRVEDPPDSAIPDTYRQNRTSDADHVVDAIASAGGNAVAVEADLSRDETIELLFNAAESSFGPVDILINNATGWIADTFGSESSDRHGRGLRRVSADTIDQQFAVDARGAALLISEFAARHSRHRLEWGRIIGLTSGGRLGFPQEVSYGAAKAALENYTMSAAFELADRGITANMVYPPVTDTGWVTTEVRKTVEQAIHLIHVSKPEEVADVIVYLASEHARLITGNIIHLR